MNKFIYISLITGDGTNNINCKFFDSEEEALSLMRKDFWDRLKYDAEQNSEMNDDSGDFITRICPESLFSLLPLSAEVYTYSDTKKWYSEVFQVQSEAPFIYVNANDLSISEPQFFEKVDEAQTEMRRDFFKALKADSKARRHITRKINKVDIVTNEELDDNIDKTLEYVFRIDNMSSHVYDINAWLTDWWSGRIFKIEECE